MKYEYMLPIISYPIQKIWLVKHIIVIALVFCVLAFSLAVTDNPATGDDIFYLSSIVGFWFVIVVLYMILVFKRFEYSLSADHIKIAQGGIRTFHYAIPFKDIVTATIKRGIFDQLFGLSTVTLTIKESLHAEGHSFSLLYPDLGAHVLGVYGKKIIIPSLRRSEADEIILVIKENID